MNVVDADVDNNYMLITDGVRTIDAWVQGRFDRDVTAAGATTTVTEKYFPRRMLVPPGGVATIQTAVFMSLVECGSLEDALAIL